MHSGSADYRRSGHSVALVLQAPELALQALHLHRRQLRYPARLLSRPAQASATLTRVFSECSDGPLEYIISQEAFAYSVQ